MSSRERISMNTKKLFTNKVSAGLLASLCAILWGSAFPALKISYEAINILPEATFDKIYFAGLRFFIASILLFIISRILLKESLLIKKKNIKFILVLGLLQTAIMYYFFYNGLSYTSGIKSSILISSNNFFVVILAHFIYHDDRINSNKILGLTTGFLGIVLVNLGSLPLDLSFTFRGEGFLILSALSGSFGNLLAKKLTKDIHPFKITAWQMLFGSTTLLIIGKIGMKDSQLTFNPLSITLLIYTAFLSAIAFALWFMLLKYNKAGEITLYRFLIPISGSILSIIFLPGENFSVNILLGLILVSGGIILINKKQKNMTDTNISEKASNE